VRRFFAEQAERRIWCAPDPAEAMREFLGLPKRGRKQPQRGAPKGPAGRNQELAADIQERIDAGDTVGDACLKVYEGIQRSEHELDPQYLRKIYFREIGYPIGKNAVRATIKRRELARWTEQHFLEIAKELFDDKSEPEQAIKLTDPTE
jgi:hypothetical protein